MLVNLSNHAVASIRRWLTLLYALCDAAIPIYYYMVFYSSRDRLGISDVERNVNVNALLSISATLMKIDHHRIYRLMMLRIRICIRHSYFSIQQA